MKGRSVNIFDDLVSALTKIPWGEISAFCASMMATAMIGLKYWDTKKQAQANDVHEKRKEIEAIKASNGEANIKAQEEINAKQSKEITDLSNILQEHTVAMQELRTTLKTEVAKMTEQYNKTFYGAALVHRENKNIKEQMEKFSTVHKKLSDYATMITSKKEGT